MQCILFLVLLVVSCGLTCDYFFHCLGQLTWLVYFIGSVIGGRVSFTNGDDEDSLDGELVYRVLQLMSLTDSRLPQVICSYM